MVDKEEVDGQLPYSGLKMEVGHRVRPGTSFIPYSRGSHELIKSSSLRSNSSKKIPPLSLPAAQKKKSAENVGVNRAIPGPGDEVEAEPDAGVLDSEKVTVVFLVSYLSCFVQEQAEWQCEQVSHHPPISAAYYGCPAKGIEATGVDQILARVSGMCTSTLSLHDIS